MERGKRFSKCNPTVEITADDYYASFHPVAGSDLCPGDTEWTVTADGETESDVLTVTDE